MWSKNYKILERPKECREKNCCSLSLMFCLCNFSTAYSFRRPLQINPLGTRHASIYDHLQKTNSNFDDKQRWISYRATGEKRTEKWVTTREAVLSSTWGACGKIGRLRSWLLHDDPEKAASSPSLPSQHCLSCLFRLRTLQGQKSHTAQLNCTNITCSHQANNNLYLKLIDSWNRARPSSISWQGIHDGKGGRERLRGAETA